jgi:hypothetical protein
MIFEEWRDNRYGLINEETPFFDLSDLQAAWEASRIQALAEANSAAGDRANEGEKDARRTLAVTEIIRNRQMSAGDLADIIEKAQG